MPPPAGRRFVPHLLLVAMIAIWGASYAVVKVALAALPPFLVVALRFWLAVLCLLPFVGRGLMADLRRTRGPGLLAGAALVCGYLLQTIGMNETSASMGGFLSGLIVLLTGVGGFVFFRARFGALSVFGFLLGLAGIVLLCWPGGADADGPRDTARGIALQIGSSTSYAAHILLLSRFGRDAPPLALCLWQLLVVAVASTLAAGLAGDLAAGRLAGIDWDGGLVAAVAYLGVLATALGIAVQGKVQHRIPPVHVALLFTLQPLFAALVAWAALGDRMGGMQLAGGGAIVLGVLVTSLDRR
ncbi:MAG: DMT family transporter [Planctomycetes bacterium]|nr:DMT family transporter [Planctomycetota bacterium]